jgi:hypothetical protein
MRGVYDSWLVEVDSFRPPQNSRNVQVLSQGIYLSQSVFTTTVRGCHFADPEYRGEGANGYLFHVNGTDLLLEENQATHPRHGFIVNQAASGNVFLKNTTTARGTQTTCTSFWRRPICTISSRWMAAIWRR